MNPQRTTAEPAIGKSDLTCTALLVALLVALFACILALNGGTFAYALDDAYIHLSLSEQIARGHYGLDASEPSSPASSILFPALLAPFAGTPLHAFVPLAANSAALLATGLVFARLFRASGISSRPMAGVIAASTAILLHQVGLAFSGMEHSIHVWLSVSTLYGLIVVVRDGFVPRWLPAAIVAAPLVRYEGLAPSLAAVAVLALRGHGRTAALSLACLVTPLLGFSLALTSLGLPWLPSSVLHKSVLPLGAGLVESIRAGFVHILVALRDEPAARSLLFAMLAASAAVAAKRRDPAHRCDAWILGFGWVCVGAHLAAGRFGWFSRYEVYVVAIAVGVLAYTLRDGLAVAFQRRPVAALLAWWVGLIVAWPGYIAETFHTPLASNNIYEQHGQMHRFAVDFYGDAVAVNDIGWVTYRNPHYVQDLTGLGSEETRRMQLATRAGGAPRATWVPALLAEKGIGLAMVADPAGARDYWTHIATLSLSRAKITPFTKDVSFYVADPARLAEIVQKLHAFEKTLPARIGFEILDPGAQRDRRDVPS